AGSFIRKSCGSGTSCATRQRNFPQLKSTGHFIRWARRAGDWAAGREPEDAERVRDRPGPKRAARDVYVYFDNDAKVRAPADALTMRRKVDRLRLKVER